MPIDTAVAAIIKQIASATVANSSMPARRRLAKFFSEVGEAKPMFPVNPVMVVILVAVLFAKRVVGESVFALLSESRGKPAPARRNLGEAFEK
jgi:hypothetical protein